MRTFRKWIRIREQNSSTLETEYINIGVSLWFQHSYLNANLEWAYVVKFFDSRLSTFTHLTETRQFLNRHRRRNTFSQMVTRKIHSYIVKNAVKVFTAVKQLFVEPLFSRPPLRLQ